MCLNWCEKQTNKTLQMITKCLRNCAEEEGKTFFNSWNLRFGANFVFKV
jgi:hypothetical protein